MTATPFKKRILGLIKLVWQGYRTSWAYKADKEDKEFEKIAFGNPDEYTIPHLTHVFTILARKAGYSEKQITTLWKSGEIKENPVRQGSRGGKPFESIRKSIPVKPPLIAGGKGNAPGSLYVALSYLSEALEKLKKNRDEMLEDFSIRKRPNHPFDFVVIAKHRSYVDGRRVYSAALKTKSRIEDNIWPFGGKIIGWRKKEKGNSDYTYEIYGIRYSSDRPNFQGKKLFDNAEKLKLQIGGSKCRYCEGSHLVPDAHKIQVGGAFDWEDVSEEIEGTQQRRTSIYPSKKEAMKDAREFKKMGYAVRVLRANSYRMPTTAAQERANKIAKMRKEGLEPLPYGLEKATLRQLQMLGHGDSIWSKKWGMRVKKIR